MRNIQLFLSLAQKANNIVISTHIGPDADGIGSEIALCMALRELGKNAVCVNEEPLIERYNYLDPQKVVYSYEDYVKENVHNFEIDLFIVADTNSLPRIGNNVQKIVTHARNLLFIDHHPCPKELAAIHCIDTSMAATGELVGRMIEALGVKFTKEMALALYTAILIDTSSFRYPTVTGDTHRLVGTLMDTGVQSPEAYNNIYGTKKISYMQMLGTVLAGAGINKSETIAWLCITEDIMSRFHVDPEDTHGFVNHLLILDDIKIVCMFREVHKHIKISFRSTGMIDVGIMAQALGGGGHNHSAATIIEGKLEEVVESTIEKLEKILSEIESNTEH